MTWNNNPRNFTLQLLSEADDFTKKITGEMLQQVILKSPVDTGAYRNNHRVGIGNIDNSYDANDTGNNAESIGVAKIRAGGGLGKIVHVSNSLPYALALENGHSEHQAPFGIYAISFRSVVEKYK